MKGLISVLGFLFSSTAFAVPAYWLAGSNGYTGRNPVLAGYENGHPIYVCRAGRMIPGKLHPVTGKCYIGHYRLEYGYQSYEVLQDPERRLYWANRNRVAQNKLFIGGQEGNTTLHVCRVSNGAAGKLVGGVTGVCFYGWYGSELASNVFDILAFP